MRPSMGRWPAWRAGILPNGTAWFFNPDAGFAFYDTARQQLVDRLATPVALKSDGTEARNDYLSYGVLESTDGRMVHLLLYHDGKTDLHVIDVENRIIASSVLALPKGYPLCPPVLDQDGRILVSTYRHDDGIVAGVLRIDPQSGQHELSMCDGSSARSFLIRSSPCGRYWLRADNSRLHVVSEEAPLFSRLLGRGAAARKEHFSFAVEIWEAFPLRRLHSVAPMWMTPEQLPDQGHIDYDRQKQGSPVQRGQIYRKVAELLDRDTSLATSQIGETSHPELWPDSKGFYTNINSNLREFELAEREVIGWQPDSQAFWLKRHNFVACVGVDGTVSPKIMLERFGMNKGGWQPAARGWYDATVLPDRRLDLRFEEGTVTVSGTPGDPVHAVRSVPTADDHFRPAQPKPPQQQDKDAALAKKAETIAKRYSTYSVDLASLNEADCVAAIDALTAQIGPDINERPFDNHLQAVFRHGGKRLNEKKFFTHVAANCPSAAPALRRLIDAVCTHVGPHTQAWYDPYGDDIPTALFGYAAWCLAKLDASSNEVLLRYYRLVDTDHEHFYFAKIVPLMLDNTADPSERLQLAEGFYFGDLGNAIEHAGLWRMAKMAETAASLMTPKQYAAHLMELAAQTSTAPSRPEYGYYYFDNLARFLTDPTPWETELLQELRTAAAELAPQ